MVINPTVRPTILDTLFSSRARARILARFLLQPDAHFHARALAKTIGVQYSAVWKELTRLERAGILESDTSGRIKYYSLNPSLPIRDELRGIVLKTVGLGDVIRKAFANRRDIDSVFIYGSFALGDMDALSDIDLMLIGDVDLETVSPLISRLEKELGRSINYAIFTEKEWMERVRVQDPFIANVLASPKVMLIGDENGLRRIAAPGQDKALSRAARRNNKAAPSRRPRPVRRRAQSGR